MANLPVLDRLPAPRTSDPCCAEVQPASLTVKQSATMAARLKAISDPTRLAILDLLAQQPEPLCVCELTPRFPQNQPTISHHLKLLRDADLVDTEKRGIWSYFWATEEGRRTLNAIARLG